MLLSKLILCLFFTLLIFHSSSSASPILDNSQIESFNKIQKNINLYLIAQKEALKDYPPDNIYKDKISVAYKNLLPRKFIDGFISSLPENVLQDYFKAANQASLYTSEVAPTKDMLIIAKELERRGKISRTQALDVFNALFAIRDFEEAETWSKRQPFSLPEHMPIIIEKSKINYGDPSELIISKDSNVIQHQNVDFDKEILIIAVVHPLCHFSQNAIEQIMNDSALSSAWLHHVKWVAPQGRNYDIDIIRNWNSENPRVQMSIAYEAVRWSKIDSWETPIFYFFRSGKLLSKITGWPKNGHMQELRESSLLIGLDLNIKNN